MPKNSLNTFYLRIYLCASFLVRLLMWMGKKNSSGANIDQFAVCQLFVLAVNLDLACPLSFGKKHRRDLTNKSITGRTLVEEHFSPDLRTGRQRLTSSLLIAKFSWSAFKSDNKEDRASTVQDIGNDVTYTYVINLHPTPPQ